MCLAGAACAELQNVEVGREHLFAEDGVDDGSFILLNGLDFAGGTDDDDVDYIYFDTQLRF